MANENAAHDANRRKVMLAVDDTTGETVQIPVDASGNILIAATIANLTVANGGTGVTSFTAYAPIFGGTTTTGALQSGTVGSAGQVLTSNGAGALPTFQAAAASGAPTDATYITQTANGSLSAEQALSSLATGLVQVTTTTGVLSSVTTSAGIAALISDETGSGALVFATSPVLVTPTLGVASATSINKVAITAPATSATLTIADGKTLTVSKTMSFTAADDTGTYTLPTGTKTLVATDVSTLSSLSSVGTIATGVWNGTAVDVAHGGTGDTSLTAYAVLCGGTTSTSAVQSIADVGTTGYVLTSNGAGALPTFQAAAGGTPRRNLNIIMDVARLITRGTAPTNEASSQMIDCTITTSNGISCKALNLGANSEMYDWYDKDPEINITCLYSAGSITGDGKWFFGDTGGTQDPTNTTTAKSMYVYVRTAAGTSTVYAVNANGTTNTNTSLSSVTLNSTMLWRVVKNSTTNIKYYYNYTLKATHTTNLPSGDFNDGDTHYFAVRNDTGDTTTRTGTFGLCDLLINSPTG